MPYCDCEHQFTQFLHAVNISSSHSHHCIAYCCKASTVLDDDTGTTQGVGLGGVLAPPLFWLIKPPFFFTLVNKVCLLQKKVHYVILCQICGPLRKHSLIVIQSSFSRVFSYRHGQMRQFVVSFVPEQMVRFSPVKQWYLNSCFRFHSFLNQCFLMNL